MNKQYWDKFYKNNPDVGPSSTFAKFVLCFLDAGETLLDLGCGNGKDTEYFVQNKINAIGLDNNKTLEGDYFLVGDVLENLQKSDNYYLRFFAHAVEEEYLDKLLDKINIISDDGAKIFIETRSAHGIVEIERFLHDFKSGVGNHHKRMLYSFEYFVDKVSKSFEIFYKQESFGLSPFKGEDPCLIRICARKVKK